MTDISPSATKQSPISLLEKIRHRSWLLILIISMLIAPSQAGFQLDPQKTRSGSTVQLEYIVDADGTHNIDDVLTLAPSAWKPLLSDTASFGFDTSAYWFRWRYQASELDGGKHFVEIAYPLLNQIDLFSVRHGDDKASIIKQWRMGDKQPFDTRPYSHPNFVVPVMMAPGEAMEFIARVRSNSSIQVPVRVWNEADFRHYDQLTLLVNGIFIGLMVSIVLYNFVLWLTVGERLYLSFFLWVANVTIVVVTLEGLSFQYLWPDSLYWNDQVLVLMLIMGSATGLAFSFEFIRPEPNKGPWTRHLDTLLFVSTACITLLTFSLSYQIGIQIAMGLVFLSFVNSLLYGVRAALKGHRRAQIYVIGFTGVAAVVIFVMMGKFSIFASNIISDSAIKLALGLEILVISLALAPRLSEEHKLRQQAQHALLNVNEKARNEIALHVADRTRQLEEVNRELSRLSMTDALTGLPNRRYFDEVFAVEAKRAASAGNPLSIALLDVDHFKNFNDTHGHAAGDACLRLVARELLRQTPRNGDLAARYGGEEFCILMPNANADGAMIVAERIRRGILGMRVETGGSLAGVTVSIGVHTVLPQETPADLKSLLDAVDRALYRAKQTGRNKVVAASELADLRPISLIESHSSTSA